MKIVFLPVFVIIIDNLLLRVHPDISHAILTSAHQLEGVVALETPRGARRLVNYFEVGEET